MNNPLQQFDAKELDLPETLFIRDIDTRLFQSIVHQCILRIEGVTLPEGNLIDNLLGRDPSERVSGISIEQDLEQHSVRVKVELNVAYGISIPEKSEELQWQIAKEISKLTGLHVASVHLVFKNLISKSTYEELPHRAIQESLYSEEL